MKNNIFVTAISSAVVSLIAAIIIFPAHTVLLEQRTLGVTNPIAGMTYTLAGSGVSASATSMTLSSFTIPQTSYKILTADLSSTFYLTLEPGSNSRQEIVSCTTVTQNTTTATLSGCTRGLLPFSPYTASSTYQFAHGGGTSVVLSNPPQLYNQFAALGNSQTITGAWSFPEPTTSSNAATKNYADNLAIAGAPNGSFSQKGIYQEATTSQLIAGTQAGSTGADLIVPNLFFASTTSANVRVPVTQSSGFLKQGWFDLTQLWNFTGGVQSSSSTFTGTFGVSAPATFTATTTFSGAVSGVTNLQTFNSSSTWTKPAGATYVDIIVAGAGGGGGSGRNGPGAESDQGGGGGGGGAVSIGHFDASVLGATETVTIGTGGTAGAAQASGSNNGNDGGNGSGSSFGSWIFAGAGGGGKGGTATTNVGGGGGSTINNANLGTAGSPTQFLGFSTSTPIGGQGATGLASGANNSEWGGASGGEGEQGVGGAGGSSIYAAGGGGAGGGIITNSTQTGGAGGNVQSYTVGGGGAGGAGSSGTATAGTAGVSNTINKKGYGGQGGGGGGSSTTSGSSGVGAIGGFPGGGGGGGGANHGTSGAGAAGANGRVIVITHL